jgi:hypothetical protein
MDVSIEVWRGRIGCFNPKVRLRLTMLKCGPSNIFSTPRNIFCFTLVLALLCIAEVERNPGPGDELSLKAVQGTLAKLISDSKSETLGAVNDLSLKVNSLGDPDLRFTN